MVLLCLSPSKEETGGLSPSSLVLDSCMGVTPTGWTSRVLSARYFERFVTKFAPERDAAGRGGGGEDPGAAEHVDARHDLTSGLWPFKDCYLKAKAWTV